jgi:hypothetical protein
VAVVLLSILMFGPAFMGKPFVWMPIAIFPIWLTAAAAMVATASAPNEVPVWLLTIRRIAATFKNARRISQVAVVLLSILMFGPAFMGKPFVWLSIAIFPIWLLAVAAMRATASAPNEVPQRVRSAARGLAVIGFTCTPLFDLSVYAIFLYGKIPVELGGGRPRCVYVELDASKLGQRALRILEDAAKQTAQDPTIIDFFPPEHSGPTAQHSEVGPIYLWSQNDKRLLVGDNYWGTWDLSDRVEIPADAIYGTIRCQQTQYYRRARRKQ